MAKWESSTTKLESYLSHYFSLIEQRTVSYYLRCKSLPVEFDPTEDLTKLFEIHEKMKGKIKELDEFKQLDPDLQSFLDLKCVIASKMLQNCNFCERNCGVNRKKGEKGFCGQSEQSFISSAFLHWGEEQPLVPSGTIFFNGCTFDCVFCQNFDIASQGKKNNSNISDNFDIVFRRNDAVTPEYLGKIATRLFHQGALNINYVGGDPTPHIHIILESMKFQHENICQLWNSNFYLSDSALTILLDVMDLWLPDFKYGNDECAYRYSKVPHYWSTITHNFLRIYQEGSKNIIIRHLVMPNHVECCTKPILKWIADNIPKVVVNIMGQYHPDYQVSSLKYSELNRRVSSHEMQKAYEFADKLNLTVFR
ncbi:MAG: radical SAM protein [Candidatus Lokiarchaeota archaeon]|nr:radical SAM protein [Candidatus Harpocratesius repetitus]